ncbi:hypothetical protein [Sphingomonas sp. LR55]|uniref:hypothetical protein n=1 Tax=Sphingomonas sp. LR55 TaxID=3050231 RepID=UPI002FE06142
MGAMGAGITGAGVTFGQTPTSKPAGIQGSTMTPQDQEFIFAKVDGKLADMRSDVRLNTQGLADLKERFVELSGRMSSVPTDLATLKTKVDLLPGKGFVVTAAIGSVTGLTGLLILLQKLGVLH